MAYELKDLFSNTDNTSSDSYSYLTNSPTYFNVPANKTFSEDLNFPGSSTESLISPEGSYTGSGNFLNKNKSYSNWQKQLESGDFSGFTPLTVPSASSGHDNKYDVINRLKEIGFVPKGFDNDPWGKTGYIPKELDKYTIQPFDTNPKKDGGFLGDILPLVSIAGLAMGLPGLFESLGAAGTAGVAGELATADAMAGLIPATELSSWTGLIPSFASENISGLDSLFKAPGFSGESFLGQGLKPSLGFDITNLPAADLTSSQIGSDILGTSDTLLKDYGNFYNNSSLDLLSPNQYSSGPLSKTGLQNLFSEAKNMWNKPLYTPGPDSNLFQQGMSTLSSPNSLSKLYSAFNSMQGQRDLADTMEKQSQMLQGLSGQLDPFGSQRGYYQGLLKNLYSNPMSDPYISNMSNIMRNKIAANMSARGRTGQIGDIMGQVQTAITPAINDSRNILAKLAGSDINPAGLAQLYGTASNLGTQAAQTRYNSSGMIPYALANIFKSDSKDSISALVDKLLG